MKRMGVVISPQGAPLANRPVTVRDWATGAVVTTLTTNANGRWEIDLPDEAKQYWIDVWQGGSSSQLTVQTPASIELEHLFVRYGLKARAGAVVDLPAGTTIGGVVAAPGAYVLKAGDTMSGDLTAPNLIATVNVEGAAARIRHPSSTSLLVIGGLHAGDQTSLWLRRSPATPNYDAALDVTAVEAGDGLGTLNLRAATTTLTGVATVAGMLTGLGGVTAQKAATPTQGLIHLGNSGAKYLDWNAARLTIQDMPMTLALVGANATSGFILSGNLANDASMRLTNAGGSQGDWYVGVEGSRGVLGVTGSLFINNAVTGSLLTVRPDGRVGIGLAVGVGATAGLDVQAKDGTVPSVRVLAHASNPASVPIFTVIGPSANPVFGVCALGPSSGIWSASSSVSTVVRAVPWYDNVGGFIGWMPLYSTRA